jgi:elongation factor P--(R)-beta-lysine ligase
MNSQHALRFKTLSLIRRFFEQRGFTDVLTPPAVQNPGMEVHLHPFQLASALDKKLHPLYLHTSPEFKMKELLADGFENIFTLTYCFRDEPQSTLHRPQFLMLEWYRAGADYNDLAHDTQELVDSLLLDLDQAGFSVDPRLKNCSFVTKTVEEVFVEFTPLNKNDLENAETLTRAIDRSLPEIKALIPEGSPWVYEDLFFLVFLNCIEPKLSLHPKLILKDYPAPLAALSTLKPDNPQVCQRFELYLNGVEIANCFDEETSAETIKERFFNQGIQKKQAYNYELPKAHEFFATMNKGIPKSSGIALGVERLAGALTNTEPPFWS